MVQGFNAKWVLFLVKRIHHTYSFQSFTRFWFTVAANSYANYRLRSWTTSHRSFQVWQKDEKNIILPFKWFEIESSAYIWIAKNHTLNQFLFTKLIEWFWVTYIKLFILFSARFQILMSKDKPSKIKIFQFKSSVVAIF